MNHIEFNKLLDKILKRTTNVLASKSAEYSTDKDKMHNFKRAGGMLDCTPEKALVGMMTKHIISILDIVDEIEANKFNNTDDDFDTLLWHAINYDKFVDKLEEKITDAINYLILLEALIKE